MPQSSRVADLSRSNLEPPEAPHCQDGYRCGTGMCRWQQTWQDSTDHPMLLSFPCWCVQSTSSPSSDTNQIQSVLYLGMTIYKWNNYVIAGDQDQASRSVTQRMMSRDGSGRRLAPLLRLFVRDEAVVFTVIVVLQSVQASFAISDGLHMYAGSVFTWFQVLLAICVRLDYFPLSTLDGTLIPTAIIVGTATGAQCARLLWHRWCTRFCLCRLSPTASCLDDPHTRRPCLETHDGSRDILESGSVNHDGRLHHRQGGYPLGRYPCSCPSICIWR
jgi:hypothetical protein